MSEAIITKYRPMRFEDVIGQPHVLNIKKKCELGKVPNAFLFMGVHGTGKTTTARLVAMALNSPNAIEGNPTLSDLTVQAILDKNNPNVKELDMATNRGIEDVRNIQKELQYAAVNDGYRVLILDEAHQITKQGASALLKSLEEPPKNTLFILCTTDPQKLLPTIRSRCERYDFKRVGVEDLISRLQYICEQENQKYTVEGLKIIAIKARGSVRDAESLLSKHLTDGIVDKNSVATIVQEQSDFGNLIKFIETNNKIELLKYFRKNTDITYDEAWIAAFADFIIDHAISINSLAWATSVSQLTDWLQYLNSALSMTFTQLIFLRLADNFKADLNSDLEIKKHTKSNIENFELPLEFKLYKWFGADVLQWFSDDCFSLSVEGHSIVYAKSKSKIIQEGDFYILGNAGGEILSMPVDTDKNILIDKGLLEILEDVKCVDVE